MSDVNLRIFELMQLIDKMSQDLAHIIHNEEFNEKSNDLVTTRHRLLLELVTLSSKFKDQYALRQFLEKLRDSEEARIKLASQLQQSMKIALNNMGSLKAYVS
ncbi:MAG: hypothetical protein ACYCQI_02780 [Gammaproteobacteria bacterium]